MKAIFAKWAHEPISPLYIVKENTSDGKLAEV